MFLKFEAEFNLISEKMHSIAMPFPSTDLHLLCIYTHKRISLMGFNYFIRIWSFNVAFLGHLFSRDACVRL